MQKKRIIITDFYPMRKLENYECLSLTRVAVARNVFMPQLNPFNYEVGIFGIDFRYKPCKNSEIEAVCRMHIRVWKDFLNIFPQVFEEKKPLEFLQKNIGIRCTRNNEDDAPGLLLKIRENLETGMPIIVYCNPYHLHYTDYYQTEPGGAFRTYHQLVVFGISPGENKVWVYDPTLKNYYGVITLKEFADAVEDGNGIENFEGPIYSGLQYNGKKFTDINSELLINALEYYLKSEDGRIQPRVLAFFKDITALYHAAPGDDYRNKLLEFASFTLRRFGYKRLYWWDFLEYYKKIAGFQTIAKENDDLKEYIDRLFGIPNVLYTNTLKKKKKLDPEKLTAKMQLLLEEETSIIGSLYTKLKKG